MDHFDKLGSSVGKVVLRLRKAATLTQQELADRAGLERSYISLLESGQRLPGLEVLIRISKALEIPVADLVREIESTWLMLATNGFAHRVVSWVEADVLQDAVQRLPFALAVLAAMLVADLVQYAAHRCFHEVPWLWRFHAVHHSVRTMDWLAGSRLHLVEVLVTRSLVLAALLAAGFTRGVIDAYIVIVGFHAVLNHANVNLRLGPLRHLIVTPAYHHWHHASEAAAIDRNYAAHFPFIDRLFGTQVRGAPEWPGRYGVVEDDVPDGFWAQTLHPFRRR